MACADDSGAARAAGVLLAALAGTTRTDAPIDDRRKRKERREQPRVEDV